jgi:hypothetical protein
MPEPGKILIGFLVKGKFKVIFGTLIKGATVDFLITAAKPTIPKKAISIIKKFLFMFIYLFFLYNPYMLVYPTVC